MPCELYLYFIKPFYCISTDLISTSFENAQRVFLNELTLLANPSIERILFPLVNTLSKSHFNSHAETLSSAILFAEQLALNVL